MNGAHRILTGLAAAAAVAALPAGPAHASATRTGTLDCGSGGTFAVETNSSGSSVMLVDTRQIFVLTYLRVDRTGQELVKHSPGKQRLDTLSCTYSLTGKEPGDTATAEGFLTPPRPRS